MQLQSRSDGASTALSTMPDRADVDRAIARGRRALLDRQRPDGSFEDVIDVGPISTATQLLLEHELGVLSQADAAAGRAALLADQQADGSFLPFPRALRGSPVTTAVAIAALEATGLRKEDEALRQAHAYLGAHGGFRAAVEAFLGRGDVSALYLAAAGRVSSDFLPRLPLAAVVAPGLERLLDGRFHAGNLLALIVMLAVSQQRRGPSTRGGGGALLQLGRAALRDVEQRRAIDILRQWQNPSGGFNEALFPTQLMALGLHALGQRPSDSPLRETMAWLARQKHYPNGQLRMQAIPNDVWGSAMAALALHAATPEACEALDRTATYLLSQQHSERQPRANQRKWGAERVGGWAFQRGNPTMPDCDDTGLCLAALGSYVGKVATREAFAALDRGIRWLREMQNPEGGWGAYVWNLPGKPPGPLFLEDVTLPPLDDWKGAASMFLDPPPELGDPATEGVTARVLWGLGAAGVGRNDPAVCRAIEFLRHQQCDNGAFWDRWMTCYLPGTATALLGLRAVGEPTSEPYVQRAVRWMKGRINPDGGFGETHEAFRNPLAAGKGPSMPAVTGFVISALVACGEVEADETRAAVRYLVERQQAGGGWPNCGWVNPYVPPDTFYEYPLMAQIMPLLALSQYRSARP